MSEHLAPYDSPRHRDETAIAGMWLFLASEILLFGGLFLIFVVYSHTRAAGWALGVRHTNLMIGGINTALLLTSSMAYTLGVDAARNENARGVILAGLSAAGLGVTFLCLKGWEWHTELADHLFPGPGFALGGPQAGGAQLFYSFYFLSTALHGLHMLVGIGLIGWICLRTYRGRSAPLIAMPVEVVGLYWSFVDLVWVLLFPVLYLIGRV
ncbi:cytochrome c oxidase subunit 3 [Acetobacter sp. TBRC 12305]|uniref:Cytochrome c oxidase subunit 3 n=1 Tax=Acetobacter garciniae TaxID=2817435 RepID=A0A939HNG7_9PROT|nr:cytochrome c oxidase subunit 3 [Acetobacter garciniae]MBO1325521.1 cytochrome c oxidase subunit 3 [Acetobacter garciniae]MBX0345307.1 cytochrome c oxidase subunit 3 [Acetobacter garciniae]